MNVFLVEKVAKKVKLDFTILVHSKLVDRNLQKRRFLSKILRNVSFPPRHH